MAVPWHYVVAVFGENAIVTLVFSFFFVAAAMAHGHDAMVVDFDFSASILVVGKS